MKYLFTKRKNTKGFLKLSVIENVVYKTEFEKLRRNLRKGILKGIYWILTGLRVGILYEFGVVLLRDFFYYNMHQTAGQAWQNGHYLGSCWGRSKL